MHSSSKSFFFLLVPVGCRWIFDCEPTWWWRQDVYERVVAEKIAFKLKDKKWTHSHTGHKRTRKERNKFTDKSSYAQARGVREEILFQSFLDVHSRVAHEGFILTSSRMPLHGRSRSRHNRLTPSVSTQPPVPWLPREEIEERKLMTVISSRAFIVGAQARARIESNDRRYGDESFCLVRARERKPAERLLTSYGKWSTLERRVRRWPTRKKKWQWNRCRHDETLCPRQRQGTNSVLNLCPHTRERKTNVRTDTHLNTFLTATRPATDKTLRLSPTSTIIFLVLSLVEVSMGCSRVLVCLGIACLLMVFSSSSATRC